MVFYCRCDRLFRLGQSNRCRSRCDISGRWPVFGDWSVSGGSRFSVAAKKETELMRLQTRKARLWTGSYLAYRYLWPNLAAAVQEAKSQLPSTPTVLDVGCGNK